MGLTEANFPKGTDTKNMICVAIMQMVNTPARALKERKSSANRNMTVKPKNRFFCSGCNLVWRLIIRKKKVNTHKFMPGLERNGLPLKACPECNLPVD